MTDTVRTLSALQTLLADNTSNAITPQMLRDMLVSLEARSTWSVEEFGTVDPTGTVDSSAAFIAAAAGVDPNRGGRIFVPQGKYRLSSNVPVLYVGTEFIGEGVPGTSTANAQGSTRIISDNGITVFTFNGAGTTHSTASCVFRRLHIRAATGATTGAGILIRNAVGTIIEDVTCSDFVGGAGLTIDGTSNGGANAQYSVFRNYSAGNCLYGLDLKGTAPNGVRMFGGYFEGNLTPLTGSIGINIETGDTHKFFGVVVQGYAIGLYNQSSAQGIEVHGLRTEYCNIGVRVGASSSHFSVFGMSADCTQLTGGGSKIAIQVDAGAQDTLLMPTAITNGITTPISDAGTRTKIISTDPTLDTYAAGASPSLAHSSNYLASDTTMTTNGTYYDGPSITPAAGTYLLNGTVFMTASSSAARQYAAKLWDGTTTYSSSGSEVTGTAAPGQVPIALNAVVTTDGSKTYKISVSSTVAADTLKGGASGGSSLIAIKIG